jgi:hypothetical protein
MKALLYRRCAMMLARWASRLLTTDCASWGEAMRCEVEHIDDARVALRWAAGALWAAGLQRTGKLLTSRWAACGIALCILLQALGMLFAPTLIIAWRLRWLQLDGFLGGQLPGDQYQRFIPLMNSTPLWQMALWIAVALLFLVAGWRLLRRGHGAFALFATAVLLVYASSSASWIDMEFHPALAAIYRHTFTFTKPNFRRDDLIPTAQQVFPLLVAAILWCRERLASHSRHPETPRT